MPTVAETHALAAELHAGQTDKAGAPYITHLERVHAHLVRLFPDATEAEQCAALLHDALEDTAATAELLAARGYADDVVAIVRAMTKPAGVGYLDYVAAIAEAGNRGVVRVKLADNADNGDEARLAKLPPEQQVKLREKYRAAREILQRAL